MRGTALQNPKEADGLRPKHDLSHGLHGDADQLAPETTPHRWCLGASYYVILGLFFVDRFSLHQVQWLNI